MTCTLVGKIQRRTGISWTTRIYPHGKGSTMEEWRQRLVDRIAELGLSQAEVARRAGIKPTMLTDIIVRETTPSVSNALKIAAALGFSLSELYEGKLSSHITLAINGIYDGDTVRQASEVGESREVSIPLPRDMVETLKIASDRHETAGYRRGDIVVGVRTSAAHCHNLVGKDCIVKLASGRRLLASLMRGDGGKFSLRFFHRSQSDMQDVDLAWAAAVSLIIRE
jgi:transcriptional regulator with XRE-family HTH domain